jgi:signal transduction histidine kinase
MSQTELDTLNTLFDTLPSGLLIYKPGGVVLRMNQRARELLLLKESPVCLQDFPAYLEPLRRLLSKQDCDTHREELTLALPAQPEPIVLGYSVKCLKDIRILTFSDITQVVQNRQTLERVQNELYQSKKLASLGTLVAGVAHELNNPLTGISMSVGLIKMNLERLMTLPTVCDDSKLANQLEKALLEVNKIIRANEKASVLVNDLLEYAKPAQLVLTPLPIAELVQDFIGAVKGHSQFAQIRFQLENTSSHKVLCDRVKLEQVFYNLFKNACDAMEGNGELTLRFGETVINDKPGVVIQVKDNGPGIEPAVLSRIFDPFFTTKGHSGVGLGLSISYRTVERHGGLLTVANTSGSGTEFHIILPVYLESGSLSESSSGSIFHG